MVENHDLYFILGALEDGCLSNRVDKGEYLVEFYQKNREWLEQEIAPRLRKIGLNPVVKRFKQNYYRISIYSKRLYELLVQMKDNLYVLLKSSSLNDERVLQYTQAIYDCEGAVHKNLFRITLWSKEEQKLILIKQILEEAGIRTGKIIKSRNISGLPIYGKENLKMFTRRIGFRHSVKKAALAGKDAMAQP